jgi:hypothetical protein
MIAVAWLILAWIAGWRVFRYFAGDAGFLLDGLAGSEAPRLPGSSPWPLFLFQMAAGLWTGLLPLTWLTYGLAALLAPLLPLYIHPLLVVNTLVLVTGATFLVRPGFARLVRRIRSRSGPQGAAPQRFAKTSRPSAGGPVWASLIRTLREPSGCFFFLTALVWLALALFLMTMTFYRDGSLFRAGYSVFSDFAPHTALVSSFSQGRNWPTEYPHFPNDGIAYHFMFYFLCGNLNYLGLPLDLAINLPSVLGLITFCLLLGVLALRLTGRRATFLLTPALLFFRSSGAFFTFLGDLFRQFGAAPSAWPEIIRAMLARSVFIGNTPRDDWGLWGVNVYANQRHLLPGLSVALIILILFLPDLQSGLALRPTFRQLLTSRSFWRVSDASAWRRLALALLLGVLLPYFHGSVLVSLLLILLVVAIFAKNRLSFVIFCTAACLAAIVQSRVFAGDLQSVIKLKWHFGFILENPSLPRLLLYLLEMSGLLLPLLTVAFWLRGRQRKILIAAFCLPLLLAFTVSLTPDVTVNHKYIIICFAFSNIYIADLLARLFAGRRPGTEDTEAPPVGRWRRTAGGSTAGLLFRRLAAILLAFVLMVTGLQEMIILRNINQNTVAIDNSSPLVTWIRANTRPDAVFVSAPYHYNAFYLSGRATWLGHAYYAASAGHDTDARLHLEQRLVSGDNGQLASVLSLIESEGLDYLIIDDTLREHDEFNVDEFFFDQHFPVVAAFPQLGNMKIYNLHPVG